MYGIITQLIMPEMNGNHAYEEISKLRPGVKVIFTSGYAPEIVREKVSLSVGAKLIAKPISPTELLRKVREVLNGQ